MDNNENTTANCIRRVLQSYKDTPNDMGGIVVVLEAVAAVLVAFMLRVVDDIVDDILDLVTGRAVDIKVDDPEGKLTAVVGTTAVVVGSTEE